MGLLSKEQLKEIIEAELDTQLGDDKHSKSEKKTPNRRNGSSTKTVPSTEFGSLPIQVPRDREDECEPIIVKKNQLSISNLEEKISAMSTKGVSARDI